MRESLLSSNDAKVATDLGYKDDVDDNDDSNNMQIQYYGNINNNKNAMNENHVKVAADNDEDDIGDDNDDEDSWYGDYYKSARTVTGLEIGCIVTWPNNSNDTAVDKNDTQSKNQQQQQHELKISTCLPESSIAPMFHGTQWAGTRLWRASIVATKYMLETCHTISTTTTTTTSSASSSSSFILNENTILIELGCGLGVPGMILHSKTNCHTILTDKGDLVEQIQKNLCKNFPNTTVTTPICIGNEHNTEQTKQMTIVPSKIESINHHECERELEAHTEFNSKCNSNNITTNETAETNDTAKTTSSIQVQSLDWSIEGISALTKTIQSIQQKILSSSALSSSLDQPGQQQVVPNIVILCCDCIYEPLYGTSHEQLLLCQKELLRLYPTSYVLTSVERRKYDGIDTYLSNASASTGSTTAGTTTTIGTIGNNSYDYSDDDDDVISKVEHITDVPFNYPSEIEMYRFYGKKEYI